MDALDYRLIAAVQAGLPLTARPYAAIAAQLDMDEQDVIVRLGRLKTEGLIRRWGVVVKHRQLGYRANAMIVMDIPDDQVAEMGRRVSQHSFVNLCYRRPRQGEVWPYNLYCMIHGKNRETVLQQWADLQQSCGLEACRHEILFSRRCFKQRGAIYKAPVIEPLEFSHG